MLVSVPPRSPRPQQPFPFCLGGGWSRTGIRKVSGADLSICLSIFWHRDGSPATGAMAHRDGSLATGAMAQFFVRGRSAHLGAMWRAALSADKHPCPVAAFDSRIRRSFSAIGHAFQAGLVCHCWLVCLALASLAWQVATLGFQSQACMCEVGWFECG